MEGVGQTSAFATNVKGNTGAQLTEFGKEIAPEKKATIINNIRKIRRYRIS